MMGVLWVPGRFCRGSHAGLRTLRCCILLASLLLFHLFSAMFCFPHYFSSVIAFFFFFFKSSAISCFLATILYPFLSVPLPTTPNQPPVLSIYGPEFVPGYNGADYRKRRGTAARPRRGPDASSWILPTRPTACSGRSNTRRSSCESKSRLSARLPPNRALSAALKSLVDLQAAAGDGPEDRETVEADVTERPGQGERDGSSAQHGGHADQRAEKGKGLKPDDGPPGTLLMPVCVAVCAGVPSTPG